MFEELRELGFVVITVAFERNVEDAREWIAAAAPTHPSLIDTTWSIADRYHVENVPTVFWIDEEGYREAKGDAFRLLRKPAGLAIEADERQRLLAAATVDDRLRSVVRLLERENFLIRELLLRLNTSGEGPTMN